MATTTTPAQHTFTSPKRPLTWLITGCSSRLGLGLTLARIAKSHGHTVIATSRNPSRTPDLVAEFSTDNNRWLPLDLDDPNCGTVIDDLEANGVHIDVLVNNAGWSVHNSAEQFTEAEVRAQMESLYFGPYRLLRAAVPHMRRRRFGVVANFSSGAGLEGRETMGTYAAGKAAFDALTKVMAKEIAPFNVRMFYVSLGGFNTNMASTGNKGAVPTDPDYDGTMTAKMMDLLAGGNYKPDGDREKAMQAVYELVVGEGIGEGREAEKLLPLGRDLAVRVGEVVNHFNHAMDVFGDVCNNVHT